ncbi:MAG TPA: hypothetical protein VM223_18210 [Planctomycetota bacterium]|nr:hypothetical protein [Planctomycetota bacterium]
MSADGEILFGGPSPNGWSKFGAFTKCLRLGGFVTHPSDDPVIVEAFRPTAALIRGSLAHVGWAQYYARTRAIQRDEPYTAYASPVAAMQAYAEEEDAKSDGLGLQWRDFVDVCHQALVAYHAHWRQDEWRVLDVEHVYDVPIPLPGPAWTLRLDLVVENAKGEVIIVDHKSTGYYRRAALDAYSMSGQVLGFHWLGPWLVSPAGPYPGKTFGGVILNFAEFIEGTASDPAYTFAFRRERPHLAATAVRRLPSTLRFYSQLRLDLEASGVPYEEWPGAYNEQVCRGPYGLCPAYELCRLRR